MTIFKFTVGSFNCVKQMNLNMLLNSINGKRNGKLHHRRKYVEYNQVNQHFKFTRAILMFYYYYYYYY